VTPVEFRGDLWHKKTRVPGLLCGVVCVILRLAVFLLVELRLVTNTDGHGPMASTADAEQEHRTIIKYTRNGIHVCCSCFSIIGMYLGHARQSYYTANENTDCLFALPQQQQRMYCITSLSALYKWFAVCKRLL